MNIHPALAFIVPILVGTLTAYLAVKRGRGMYAWFFWGTFLGLIGLAILFFLPKIKENEVPVSKLDPLPEGHLQKLWYYLDLDNKQRGPISTSKLQEELQTGNLDQTTYVWNEEMDDWRRIADILEIKQLIPSKTLST